jgi:hypothetical protein
MKAPNGFIAVYDDGDTILWKRKQPRTLKERSPHQPLINHLILAVLEDPDKLWTCMELKEAVGCDNENNIKSRLIDRASMKGFFKWHEPKEWQKAGRIELVGNPNVVRAWAEANPDK